MKICVVGAGAIGGMLAVRLSEIGEEVSVIIRGANLKAVRENGMKLISEGTEHVARLAATDSPAELGAQDLVILGLKAHQLPAMAPRLKPLLGPETIVVTAQNGIPWWYFFKHGGPHEGRRLESVDPGGVTAANLDPGQVIGSIIYPAAEIIAPGVIEHFDGDRLSLGELDGGDTERVRSLVGRLREAKFRARVVRDIRSEIWIKLWGNCTFNPISALTHATLVDICSFPPIRALATAMMREAQVIGEKLGVNFPLSLEKRIAGAESVGAHKTSMLQDIEAGRPIELGALVGSVIELGKITGTPTPTLETVHALVSLLAQTVERGGPLKIQSRA